MHPPTFVPIVSLMLLADPAHAAGEPPVSREGRVVLETLGGYIGAGHGALVGYGIGVGIVGDEGDFGGARAALVGGIPGMAIGLPTGIYLTGELCGGDGNFWLTGLGVVAGSVLPVILTTALAGDDDAEGLLIALWVTLPIAGGVLFYETFQNEHAPPGPAIGFSVAPLNGGFALGINGHL